VAQPVSALPFLKVPEEPTEVEIAAPGSSESQILYSFPGTKHHYLDYGADKSSLEHHKSLLVLLPHLAGFY
jgi:hypothetical protein